MELGKVRHDLKNVFAALASGCMLIESGLPPDAGEELREYIEAMREELDRGSAIVEWLRDAEAQPRERAE